ncbi:MAG: hypothetical protein ABJN51_16035 [Sneathiella sp.]
MLPLNRPTPISPSTGLRTKKDYVLNGLSPKGHPLPEVPGLEFYGKYWYTYYALPNEKNSLSRHATFQDAAKWVIGKAKSK